MDPRTDPQMAAVARMNTRSWSEWLRTQTEDTLRLMGQKDTAFGQMVMRHVAAKDQPIVPPAPSLSDAIIESRKPKPAPPVVRTPPEVK